MMSWILGDEIIYIYILYIKHRNPGNPCVYGGHKGLRRNVSHKSGSQTFI